MHLSPAHDAHEHSAGEETEEERFAVAADLLALLGDRTRLALLYALTAGEADVTTLTEACGAARPAVSQHLARLRLAGLVDTRKEGRRVIYSLRHGHLRRLVEEALKTADHRLTGHRAGRFSGRGPWAEGASPAAGSRWPGSGP
ncbi:transcriptional regulator [Streptomyces rubradiris]|uniref:Transcriptional regulator n=1 Tax=Streptomyces rubradiris TaxID=285531 RepID=A0ABQ3R591_STRRR|nr:transcriptional regulator [Streptomyces rubradiris]GHI50983.1 transcriptional regulator [Streptomyces rubradiris]